MYYGDYIGHAKNTNKNPQFILYTLHWTKLFNLLMKTIASTNCDKYYPIIQHLCHFLPLIKCYSILLRTPGPFSLSNFNLLQKITLYDCHVFSSEQKAFCIFSTSTSSTCCHHNGDDFSGSGQRAHELLLHVTPKRFCFKL